MAPTDIGNGVDFERLSDSSPAVTGPRVPCLQHRLPVDPGASPVSGGCDLEGANPRFAVSHIQCSSSVWARGRSRKRLFGCLLGGWFVGLCLGHEGNLNGISRGQPVAPGVLSSRGPGGAP